MDVNVRTEATIYLDSEDDEDPLSLSPRASPALPPNVSLKSQVRQRFAQLQKNCMNQTVIVSTGDNSVPAVRVALRKVYVPKVKSSQVIEVVDLDDDSPSNSPKHVPSLPSTSRPSSQNEVKNGTSENKPNHRDKHNISNHVSGVPSSRLEKNSAAASISKVSVPDRKAGELPTRKRHGLHATNQVIAVASTSRDCRQFLSSVPPSPKKSKPNREDDLQILASNINGSGLGREKKEFPPREGRGLFVANQVTTIASTSKEQEEVILINPSTPKKHEPNGVENSAVKSSSITNRVSLKGNAAAVTTPTKAMPFTEASFPVVASPSKTIHLREASVPAIFLTPKTTPRKEASTSAVVSPTKSTARKRATLSAVTTPSKACIPGRVVNEPVVWSPSKHKVLGREQKLSGISTPSKNVRHSKDEIDSTVCKVVESGATNRNIFLKFIKTCVACDSSPDLKKIHEKKTHKYYNNLQPEYEESEMFRSLLEENISIMTKNPASVFTCLINVHAEMKRQRVGADVTVNSSASKRNIPVSEKKETSLYSIAWNDQPVSTGIETEEDSKEARKSEKKKQHIKNLERALRQCNLRIKQLEEAEVDWDEEDDSSYMKMQRYRRRCIDIHRKLVGLKGDRDEAIKRRTRVASSCPYPLVRTAIEQYVFKKASFPDYSDVVKIYQEANIPGLRSSELKCEAEKTFKEIGGQIQRDRQVYDWNVACAFLDHTTDPAEDDPHLKLQLQQNKKLGDLKLDEVMASFTRKQYEQRLEPTEVTDELAATTDNDNDDEEDEEEEDKESGDDVRDGVIDLGGDTSGSDSDSNRASTSNGSSGSNIKSQSEKTEKGSKNDKKKLEKKSPETKHTKSSSISKNKSLSYIEHARMNTSSNYSPNTFVSKPLRKILPAGQLPETFQPPQTLLSQQNLMPPPNLMMPETLMQTQTLLPVQIIMPAQTQLLSLGHVSPQTHLTYTVENVVNPVRKFQLEALSNYLEMKYQIDPSAIKAKNVSSTIETTSVEESASPSGVLADSTDSKAGCRYEKTGSDPEVTSTSIDGDPMVGNHVNEIDRIATGAASSMSIKRSLADSDKLTATKLLFGGGSYAESHLATNKESARGYIASDSSSTKGQIKSKDLSAKNYLATKEQSRDITSHQQSFSEVHCNYVLNRKCEKVDGAANEDDESLSSNSWSDKVGEESSKTPNTKICIRESPGDVKEKQSELCKQETSGNADVPMKGKRSEVPNVVGSKQAERDLKEVPVVKEDDTFANEENEAESGVSSNASTIDMEDWENMIVPTIVAKEVLLVPTHANEEEEVTEIETSGDVNLDSSDEYVPRSPTVKMCQWKGRDIVPTINKSAETMDSEPSELHSSLSESLIAPPPKMVMINDRAVEIPLATENIDSRMHSAATVTSYGGESAQEAKHTCDLRDQENVPPRKTQAEKAGRKGITYTVSRPRTRSTVDSSKAEKHCKTVSDTVSSRSSGLSEADVQETGEIPLATGVEQTAQTSLSTSCLPGASIFKPTARKTIGSRTFVIKIKKPPQHSEPVLRTYARRSKQSVKPEAVVAECEQTGPVASVSVSGQQTKPTARKSFPGDPSINSLLRCKSWTIERLKEEQISSNEEDSVQSCVTKMTEPDVIVIDSD